jgi:hypothetical protein
LDSSKNSENTVAAIALQLRIKRRRTWFSAAPIRCARISNCTELIRGQEHHAMAHQKNVREKEIQSVSEPG